MRRIRAGAGLLLLALALGRCGGGDDLAPPTIHYGEDVCAVCNMIISDDRYAAAVVVEVSGTLEKRAFDDIGCLLVLEEEQADGITVRKRYVRDFQARSWLEAGDAMFVHSVHLHSPMAFGTAACADRAAAERLIDEYPGDLLDFERVQERFREGNLDIDPFASRSEDGTDAGETDDSGNGSE